MCPYKQRAKVIKDVFDVIGTCESKLASHSLRNMLMIGISPPASAGRHILIYPPYINYIAQAIHWKNVPVHNRLAAVASVLLNTASVNPCLKDVS